MAEKGKRREKLEKRKTNLQPPFSGCKLWAFFTLKLGKKCQTNALYLHMKCGVRHKKDWAFARLRNGFVGRLLAFTISNESWFCDSQPCPQPRLNSQPHQRIPKVRKILAPIKIKSAPPPPQTQNTPPPLKRGILWTWVLPAERTHFSRRP